LFFSNLRLLKTKKLTPIIPYYDINIYILLGTLIVKYIIVGRYIFKYIVTNNIIDAMFSEKIKSTYNLPTVILIIQFMTLINNNFIKKYIIKYT